MRWPCLIGGIGIFPRAARNLAQLRFDIDVLMGLAILGAMALGQWDEAATVAFLYGLSEALEALSLDYARRSIRALLELAPPTAERIASRRHDSQWSPASQIRRGDRVLVRVGRYDSGGWRRSLEGDRASIRRRSPAKSVPVLREEGDPVYAGTINGDGTLEVTAAGPVGDALDLSSDRPGPASQAGRCADRAADLAVRRGLHADRHRIVAPGHAGSAALWLAATGQRLAATRRVSGASGLGAGLVVLVIACPCALVIATPVAVVCWAGGGGAGRGADPRRRIPRGDRPAAGDRL